MSALAPRDVAPTAAALVSVDEVYSTVRRIHHTPEDLGEGDLGDRIYAFDQYQLREIEISELDLEEWSHDESLSDTYAIRLRAGELPEPIVFDMVQSSIIDGLHRANAAHKAGRTTIMAYLGLEEFAQPCDADEDDEG